ncbi:triple QxxK/R motif-containing protein-like [Hydractinia symbiolongicarpus]|uniref:triple QxxK/R motif-containing protein-like n=1 Tax=Hydractinia symbiolongicarpus TaxID=13093 RepID=UPI00254B7E41|nr:triple QxxK/R motif-containing protein-like [Hydractinia symbiolongicarpus]XP_057292130.1 triple QxxK/R motif-containing protein-like [Hydractinia symbiolongicarpus]
MVRKDANQSRSDVEKYRKQLGKQEFKGRNKKHTLAVKTRAQARKSESPLKTGLMALGIFTTLLAVVYLFFYWRFSVT